MDLSDHSELEYSDSECSSSSKSDDYQSAFDEEVEHSDSYEGESEFNSSESDDSLEEGPYSNEPLADENWLAEYYQEREKHEERSKELQSRLDGNVDTDQW